jgi:hypothetical protein
MMTQTTPTLAGRLAQSIAGLNVVMVLAGLVLGIAFSGSLVNGDLVAAAVLYSVLGMLIIVRHPRHTVGWLFLIVGFFSALGKVAASLLIGKVEPVLNSALVRALIELAIGLAWIPAFLIPISLVLLYFPDGRLPSRRWWPIVVAMLMGMCGYASATFHPWPWAAQGILDTNNPLGIPGSEGLIELTLTLSNAFIAIGLIGSLVALVVRFFKSTGVERTQMKWLVYTAVVGISLLLLLNKNPIGDIVFLSLPTLFAVAIGIAILRYRLFDIDLIIRRTLIYSVLTGLLALTYFGSVLVLEGLLRGVVSGDSQIAIVLSTLVIATLFVPLRGRVQAFIDRRFYRRKYDAARTLAFFGARIRDETDLEQLSDQLVRVVEDTMQPALVSLWLKQPSVRLYAPAEHLT